MSQRTREVVYVSVAVILMGLLILFVASYIRIGQTLAEVRATQQNGSPVLLRMQEQQDQIANLAHRIRSCTTPGGECYQAGTKRTAKAVVGINEGTLRVVAAALSCQSDGVMEQRELIRCIVARSAT